MLAAMRQSRILDEVRRTGGVRVSSLTQLLQVSDMTIRRDLEVMAKKGLIAKVHGGATAIDTASALELDFEEKIARETAEKQAIAVRAAELVHPGMAVALTAGTTTWTLATHLAEIANLTIVTNSLKVAEVMHAGGRDDLTLVLTGGIRTPSDGLVGPVAVQAIRSLNVDMVIMGVHGIDERAGLTTPNLLEAETNRAFVDSARRLVVIADNTKWGVVGLSQIAPLESVTTLVTDDHLEPRAAAILAERVGEVICVESQHDDEADIQ
ncbi:DeoR/GlpR transcriptional regulator [Nakamurella silvestris]|nr:DeoR/GlpR transcriptional regulator [Nakamurella silvestris]